MQHLWPVQRHSSYLILHLTQQRFVAHKHLPWVAQSSKQQQQSRSVLPDDTIESMIKGITFISAVASGAEFDRLTSLFSALGFEQGKGWKDAQGPGRGAELLAPVGELEFVTGRPPAVPPLLVEVTQLDHIHALIER